MQQVDLSFVKLSGEKKSDTIIAIPFYSEYDHLSRHLSMLSVQTCQDFDVLIVLSNVADVKKIQAITSGRDVILIKRNADSGSAGGFFCGQKYALDNAYKYVILADVDCLPVDRQVVEKLIEMRDAGVVVASLRWMENEKIIMPVPNGNVCNYGLMSREVLLRYGLYYAPTYQGGDDAEYNDRIRHREVVIANYCEHPFAGGAGMYENYYKYWLYLINSILVPNKVRRIAPYYVNFVFSIVINMIFSPEYGRKTAMKLLELLLGYKYGSDALEELRKIDFKSAITTEHDAGMEEIEFTEYYKFTNPGANVKRVLGLTRKNFVITKTYQVFQTIILNTVLARKAFLRLSDGRFLLIADNSDPVIHLVKLAVFALILVPSVAVITLAYVLLKMFNQPDTMGYGLNRT